VDWCIETLNTQKDGGPLEDLWAWIEASGRPKQICIAVGATRYTEFGSTNFLKPGDESIVLLFDSRVHNIASLEEHITQNRLDHLSDISVLSQMVLAPNQ